MFVKASDVVRALERVRDSYVPRSTSFMSAARGSDPYADPFRPGFISTFEERHEVLRRLRDLDQRAQHLLLLWYVAGKPVTDIARALRVSRVHCYRIRARAIAAMLDPVTRSAAPAAVAV